MHPPLHQPLAHPVRVVAAICVVAITMERTRHSVPHKSEAVAPPLVLRVIARRKVGVRTATALRIVTEVTAPIWAEIRAIVMASVAVLN
jgi:hypothetical protein